MKSIKYVDLAIPISGIYPREYKNDLCLSIVFILVKITTCRSSYYST